MLGNQAIAFEYISGKNLGTLAGEAFFGGSRGIYAPEIMPAATRPYRLRKKANHLAKIQKSNPPGLKPVMILQALRGDKSPASLRFEFFRSLFSGG
jgi:hypothetical protein